MSFINFESGRVKEQLRHEKRKAQATILEKAEEDYKRRKEQKLRAAERGDDKWMLPSLDAQLQPDSKKKKKHKKEKKSKKEKKHKHKKKSASSAGSSSDSGEEQWEEKASGPSGEAPSKESTEGKAQQRDEWMTLPALFPTVTRDQVRAQKRQEPTPEEQEALRKKFLLDNPGQSERELNPYWKDGGQGLPEMQDPEPESLSLPAGSAGDHGLAWLRRALRRVEDQAKEEGRSMGDVAAERWGSLDKLKNMIEEAEQRCRHSRRDRGGRGRGRGGHVQGPKPRPREYEDWREDPSAGESAVQSEEVGNKSRYRSWLGIKEPVVPEKPSSEEESAGEDTDDEMVKELKRQYLENERQEEEEKRRKELESFTRDTKKEEEKEESDEDEGNVTGKIIFKARSKNKDKDSKEKTLERLAAFGRRPPVRSVAERDEDSDDDDKAIEAWKKERSKKGNMKDSDEESDEEEKSTSLKREKEMKSEKLLPPKLDMSEKVVGSGDRSDFKKEEKSSGDERALVTGSEQKRRNDDERKYERNEGERREGVRNEERRENERYRERRTYGDRYSERRNDEMLRDRRKEDEERKRDTGREERRKYDSDDNEERRENAERDRSRESRKRDRERSKDIEEGKDREWRRDMEERRKGNDKHSERKNYERERFKEQDSNSPHTQEGRRRTEVPEYLRKLSRSEPYEKLPSRKMPAFRKPEEDNANRRDRHDILGDERGRHSSSSSRNWKKKEFQRLEDKEKTAAVKEVEKPVLAKAPMREPSPEPEEEEKEPEAAAALTDAEMNALAAKLMKAEILGNQALVSKLKQQMEKARIAREQRKTVMTAPPAAGSKQKLQEEDVLLTRRDAKGFVRPVTAPEHPEPSGGRRRPQKVATHSKEGLRERYFPDDDKYSLENMFQREKMTTMEEANEEFARLAAKGAGRTESEYDLDDLFEEKAMREKPKGKLERLDRNRAIREFKRVERSLDSCLRCFDSPRMLKHLLIALGSKVYLSLPGHQSLAEGHCLLSPVHHVPCATQLDEDVWEEMTNFRKALVSMYSKQDLDCVFFESAMHLNRFPHMTLECIPLPKEVGDTAPIYFKKAILESEMEWSMNKKLVDLKGKGVRRAVPKGLPYFAVDFGLEDGFAHVIEDEKLFPENFAQEIIGGMLDLDHTIWRKQRKENFDTQRRKVLQFEEWWKPFDFTKKVAADDSSTSSDSE